MTKRDRCNREDLTAAPKTARSSGGFGIWTTGLALILLLGPIGFGPIGRNAESVWGQGTEHQTAAGPTASEWDSLHAVVKTFFENISDPAAGPQKGLESLLKNSPLEGENKEAMMKALSEKIGTINDQFGAYLSFESIGVKAIGRDLVVLRYLYKCQNYPVVWYFIFYRPLSPTGESGNKNWFLIHFYYDSQLNVPLWESGF